MPNPKRRKIWFLDLGAVAKPRPVLVLSIPPGDVDRNLVTYVPRTLSGRGSSYEVAHPAQQLAGTRLEHGFFVCNAVATEDRAKFTRKLTSASDSVMNEVSAKVRAWLKL